MIIMARQPAAVLLIVLEILGGAWICAAHSVPPLKATRTLPVVRPLAPSADEAFIGSVVGATRRRWEQAASKIRQRPPTSAIPATGPAVPPTLGAVSLDTSAHLEKSHKPLWKRFVPSERTLKKILPLGAMFFLILFNYTILRDTKDVLVVTSTGAEIIPFLKTYVNLPAAIAYTILFSKMSNMFSREQLFYVNVFPFLAFFLSFAFIIYPHRALLHPVGAVSALSAALPAGLAARLAAPLGIIKNWSFAVFYTMAELWGSVVVSLLFWGFANEVTSVNEAKRYYPLFSLMANVALIFSGQYVRYVSRLRANLPLGVDGWTVSLRYLMSAIAVCGTAITGIFYWMQRFVIPNPNLVDATVQKKTKQKTSMGIRESIKYLASSPYIRDLALLVICYGMSINMVEVSWKARLRQAYPDPNAYSSFMGAFSTATGSVTLLMLLVSQVVLNRFGWTTGALIPPAVLLVTGLGFFSLLLFQPQLTPILSKLGGLSPLHLAVMIGALQNILSKGAKYSLFDPCKEMAYIPLDAEQKSKGKAAIDVIGNPLGKSGGAFVQQLLIFAFGSLAASTPYLAMILFGTITIWMQAAQRLGHQFEDKMHLQNEEITDEEEEMDKNDMSPSSSPSAASTVSSVSSAGEAGMARSMAKVDVYMDEDDIDDDVSEQRDMDMPLQRSS
ncbi:unnamed protein product [Vitrella brassicaformis CCMP3155]|uniref:ADP,ATP carrier protein n=3 Tax=Vitrella brassicaformis TaxID=1169539 RepID=A0A0G4GRT6_VITBC|nr:unnamed protein product [Vitrella brassicaformis CCMP3155]|mmetsp:Transcript_18908/g.54226  ORF Transcript_18908/g.54226 Transcript_18908/m.54226 type:complete len:672 (+) Transcript_18908:154-2169(+)|eukprot:CEM33327.1 unnamed protein product [Vitrella brassicaformis CCMP3155]